MTAKLLVRTDIEFSTAEPGEVLTPIERVVVGTTAQRRRPAYNPITIEVRDENAFTGGETGHDQSELVHAAGRDLATEQVRRADGPSLQRYAIHGRQRAEHAPECVARKLEVEPEDGLVHPSPSHGQRVHQNQRSELPEVAGRARHARVERAVRVALPCPVARVGHRHHAVDDLPAVGALPERLVRRLFHRGEEGAWHRTRLDLEPELDTAARGSGVDTQPDGGEERVGSGVDDLDGATGADQALDTYGRRVTETHLDAVVVGKHRGDDFLLHLSVQGHRCLVAAIIAAQVDQRIL